MSQPSQPSASLLSEITGLIHSLSDSSANLRTLLSKLQAREDQLIQMLPELDDAVQSLNPPTHTLGLVFILNCKAGAVPLSQPQAVRTFCDQCRRMLQGCDPHQVHLVPSQFVAVCCKFTAAAIAIKSPLSAVGPLQAAVCALQPSPSHFTPLHAELLKVCLLSKCYFAARPLLKQELLHVDRDATLVTPRDLLLHHYYAGMVATGLKDYRAAVQHFTLCVSAPTHVLNTIMLEAYKKCLLCSLIDLGDVPKLPKYTSPTITRPIKNHLAAYTEFAEAFASGKPADLRAALEKHSAAFSADHNLGLAKQCLSALMRRSIRTLTETYLTLSLAHIAEMVCLADVAAAEKQVRDMIAMGQIHATIDGQKGMVHFIERSEQHDSKGALLDMEGALEQVIGLATKLHGLLGSLSVDQNYLARVSAQESRTDVVWGGEPDESVLSK